MENKEFNERESLELITSMIKNTQRKINDNSGIPFLVWGYTTVLVSLFEFLVIYYNMNPALQWGWFAIPVIGWSLMGIYWKRRKVSKLPVTFIDRAISSVWIVIGIASLISIAACILYHIGILFITTLLISMGTALTGLIIKYKLLTISGFIGMIGSLAYSIPWGVNCPGGSILVFIVIFIFMMIIPGHILNYNSKKNV